MLVRQVGDESVSLTLIRATLLCGVALSATGLEQTSTLLSVTVRKTHVVL